MNLEQKEKAVIEVIKESNRNEEEKEAVKYLERRIENFNKNEKQIVKTCTPIYGEQYIQEYLKKHKSIEILLNYILKLEEIREAKVEEYLHNNIWICKDIVDKYIEKETIRKIVNSNDPETAIYKIENLLEG